MDGNEKRNDGPGPHVFAKELQSVELMKEIVGWSRLDAWPFVAILAVLCVEAAFHASRFEWDALTWTCRGIFLLALLRVLLFLLMQWLISVRLFVSFKRRVDLEDATSVLVIPAKFVGVTEIVPLERRLLREGLNEMEEIGFEFRKQRYVLDLPSNTFEKLKFPVQETFEYYLRTGGLGSDAKALAAQDKYGENHFDVPLPAFGALLKEQMLAPFFCFQVFCVGLWCLDQYWYYSLFTLFMLVTFECTVVGQRLRNLKELRSLQTPKQRLNVYRNGRWSEVKGEGLLPGDVISIGRPTGAGAGDDERVVPADCLLLAGSCIVEEAVLTGESTPQWKASVADADPTARLVMSQDKHHLLFGGTKILQHTGEKGARIRTPDGGCLAVVLRTGFETSQGQLMRTILYSSERVTANNLETGLFILFLLCFAVSASLYVLVNGLKDPDRSRFKLILNCIMIVTSVIPPELPMELSIAVNASLVALAGKRVFCTEPFRIPYGGKVEVCCFDKTGTLTSDHLLLEGVIPPAGSVKGGGGGGSGSGAVIKKKRKLVNGVPDGGNADAGVAVPEDSATAPSETQALVSSLESAVGAFASPELLRDVRLVPHAVARIMACCHSLVLMQDEMVGDPLEKACMEAIGWSFVSDVAMSPDRRCRTTVLYRHHFSSNLKRMGIIARVEGAPEESSPFYEAMVKGAPEVIKQFLASPPADYDRQYKAFAAKGARVIALARCRLGGDADLDAAQLRSMTRQDVESRGLEFAGFAVFSCPLKPESEPALRELAESSHQLMMITGDAPLTACFAASQVHIVTRPVLILSHRAEEIGHVVGHDTKGPRLLEDGDYVWMGPDEALQIPFSRVWMDILQVASEYDLCLSGDALSFVEAIGLAPTIIPLTQVFARVSPEQKELVLVTLRAAGRITLMCGDGTNDVGGLKAAHVGVALLSANENFEKLMNLRAADRKEKAEKAAAALAELDAQHYNKESVVYKQAQMLALQAKAEATGALMPRALKDAGAKKKRQGEEMLEKMRASGQPVPARMVKMAKWMDDMEEGVGVGDMPMLKPGDASMASPFTAKASSVAPCCDIIKQGRATLVTTVTMFKILGLLCLSTAYALSVMYLQGVKLSDVQATCTGMLSAAMFFFISNAKPLPQLHRVRPHPGIFNPYFFLSLLGQFATHLGLLMYMYRLALREMPAEERQGSESDFKPNLVNSVCYIVEAVVQLSTFTVNYMGHPHNTSIKDNRPMCNSIMIGTGFIALIASNLIPELNDQFGLVKIPEHIQYQLIVLSLGMVAFNFTWERWLRIAFPAPVPPTKGYMAHVADLRRLQARAKKTA